MSVTFTLHYCGHSDLSHKNRSSGLPNVSKREVRKKKM